MAREPIVSTARIAKAYKAIALMSLPKGQSRVLAAIISHFNRESGQCDPGIPRLMKRLSMPRSTVMDAIRDLAAIKLVTVERTRGRRNSYRPNWARLEAFVTNWDEGGTRAADRTSTRATGRTGAEDRTGSTGESRKAKPFAAWGGKRTSAVHRTTEPNKTHSTKPNGEIESLNPGRRQRELLLPINNPARSEEAPTKAAEERLRADVARLGDPFVSAYLENAVVMIGVVAIEQSRRGAGVEQLIRLAKRDEKAAR